MRETTNTGNSYSSSYRWVVLIAFMLLAGINQMLWLNFVPLLGQIQDRYGVSEMMATNLTVCFPLLYVLLAMPSGAMIDRRGYRFTIGVGAVIMAIFALFRIYTDSFWFLLIGQIGIAVSQPFILNGITKLSADWFEEHQRALATGLGTAGMFAGMALGLALTPVLDEELGLQKTMIIFAALTLLSSLFFLFSVRENPAVVPVQGASQGPVAVSAPGIMESPEGAEPLAGESTSSLTAFSEMIAIVRQPALALVIGIAFLALGFFNGLTTWLEALLSENGVKAIDAGLIGGAMILGGIAGSILLPGLSDHLEKRKPVLIFCGFAGLILTVPVCLSGNLTVLYWAAGFLGFFFLPGYALLLAMSEELAGAERAGGAAGALMLAGNAGGVLVVAIMGILKSDVSGWRPAEYFLFAILALVCLLAFWTRESFRPGSASERNQATGS
ncbi:MAG: MFS transporter [Leptospiraceae bacterium]|nr:MFS transporter [Leptospiraceae bacterium]